MHAVIEEILDWRPFDSLKYRTEATRLWIGYRIGAFFVRPHATNAARPPRTILIGVT
jgi:hypothetical protein